MRGLEWGTQAWLVGLCVVTIGCSVERVGQDAVCELNSDCQELLVCAAGRCRIQCREDRDCGDGTCESSGTAGLLACLPPMTEVPCAFNSDCPEGALCIRRQCRGECREDRDCLDGTTCEAETRTCEGALVTETPDAGRMDAGPEAGLVCAQGRARCGSACADLKTSSDHCGACGNRCPTNERCVDSLCECGDPFTICASACANLSESPMHCGACGSACAGPCHQGMCCGAGMAFCGTGCIDISADNDNCGDCGRRCIGFSECVAGACAAVNDECETATDLELVAGAPTSFHYVSRFATPSTSGCGGNDGYFTVSLTQRELVYVEVQGPQARIAFVDGPCGVASTCPTPDCTNADGSLAGAVRLLEPGPHVIAVSATLTEPSRITIQHVPVADSSPTPISAGPFMLPGTLDPAVSTPATCGDGPDQAFYWVACPGGMDGDLTASTCGATEATVVALANGDGTAGQCDVGSCAPGGRIRSSVRGGSGLHVLFVDSTVPGGTEAFTVAGTRP